MEKIEDSYMWNLIALRLGWRWNLEGENDLETLGQTLRKTKVNKKDVAVVFYTKLARWTTESLYNKIDNAFKEWIEENHKDVLEMLNEMDEEDKEAIKEVEKQLEKIEKGEK